MPLLASFCATLPIPDGHLRLVGTPQTVRLGQLVPLVSLVSLVSIPGGRDNSDKKYKGLMRQSPLFPAVGDVLSTPDEKLEPKAGQKGSSLPGGGRGRTELSQCITAAPKDCSKGAKIAGSTREQSSRPFGAFFDRAQSLDAQTCSAQLTRPSRQSSNQGKR
jgi:hypothetical protein